MAIIVKLLPRAETDFLLLPDYLQDEIMLKMEVLSRFPQMGRMMDKTYQGYRFILASKNRYRIIYKITSPTLVEITTIRHCRRQLGLRPIH